MKTLEERCMAYTNCPWKNTARCNLICETCLYSDSGWAKEMLDDFNRLGRRLEALEKQTKADDEKWRVLFRGNRDTWTPYAVYTTKEGAEQVFEYLISHSAAREIRLEHIVGTVAETTNWKENRDND